MKIEELFCPRRNIMLSCASCLLGYYVVLLPVVLGSALILFKSLDRAKTEMETPIAKKRNSTASFTYIACTVYETLCPNDDP
jgi:hypothetical protein